MTRVRRTAAQPAILAALVLLGLVITAPARADVIWSAVMTVGAWGSGAERETGWQSGSGTLTATEFDYDGTTHTFERIKDDENDAFPKVLFASAPPQTFEKYFHLRVTTPVITGKQQAFNDRRNTTSRAVRNRQFEFTGILANGHNSIWRSGNTVELAIIALPVRPTVNATGDNAGVMLDWSGADAKHVGSWEYRYSDDAATLGDAAWTAIPGSDATTTSHVASMPFDTTYFFQVRAVNESGASPPSATSAGVTRTSNVGLNTRLPLQVSPVSTTAGAEAAALPVQLYVRGADVEVTSFRVQVEARGDGTLADIALVKAYRDANGNGQVDAGETRLGEGTLDDGGQVTITPDSSVTISQGTPVNVVFTLQFKPSLSAAAGVGLLGALVTFAAARRRR